MVCIASTTLIDSTVKLVSPSTPNAFVYPKDYKANPIRMREHKENKIDNLFDKILRD